MVSLRDELLGQVARWEFGFLDFGSSHGGSLKYCEEHFGKGPGLGIDFDAEKVCRARKAGYNVLQADITELQLPEDCVSFVSMLDFLEHLLSVEMTKKILKVAAAAARDFIFIRHPSFENIEYLKGLGLKLSWTDWHGHKNPLTMKDFADIFQELGLEHYTIQRGELITDSQYRQIVPLSAPTDTIYYDRDEHGDKPRITFQRPIPRHYDITVHLS